MVTTLRGRLHRRVVSRSQNHQNKRSEQQWSEQLQNSLEMGIILSEKAVGSGIERFIYVSNKTQNGVTYWKCEEHLKNVRNIPT